MSSLLPGTITSRPTSVAPCSACICMNCVDRPRTVVFSFSMPLTVLICAIWLVTCALSIGLSGSWFCICATSSFKKRSELPAASAPEEALLASEVGSVVALIVETLIVVPLQAVSGLAHLQGLEQQRLRRVHDFDVVLVRA